MPVDLLRPAAAVVRFCENVSALATPQAVIVELQKFSRESLRRRDIRVLGIWSLAPIYTDFSARVWSRTAFMHPEVPETFWQGYQDQLYKHGGSVLGTYLRRVSGPFTLSEARRAIRPTGELSWPFDYLRHNGVRDALYCPFRGWVVAYRSAAVITNIPVSARFLLGMAAYAAVDQVDKLVKRPRQKSVKLSDRQAAILSLMSWGKTTEQIAEHLHISVPTVREHISNALTKLQARDRTHAVAEAMRRGLLLEDKEAALDQGAERRKGAAE